MGTSKVPELSTLSGLAVDAADIMSMQLQLYAAAVNIPSCRFMPMNLSHYAAAVNTPSCRVMPMKVRLSCSYCLHTC